MVAFVLVSVVWAASWEVSIYHPGAVPHTWAYALLVVREGDEEEGSGHSVGACEVEAPQGGLDDDNALVEEDKVVADNLDRLVP